MGLSIFNKKCPAIGGLPLPLVYATEADAPLWIVARIQLLPFTSRSYVGNYVFACLLQVCAVV